MRARWDVRFTSQAKKDVDRLTPKLKDKLREILLEVLTDPIVYSLDEKRRIIYIERAKTHYGD